MPKGNGNQEFVSKCENYLSPFELSLPPNKTSGNHESRIKVDSSGRVHEWEVLIDSAGEKYLGVDLPCPPIVPSHLGSPSSVHWARDVGVTAGHAGMRPESAVYGDVCAPCDFAAGMIVCQQPVSICATEMAHV